MASNGVVAIIGSLNVDITTVTPQLAKAGMTMTAISITQGYGGKGANQAVACARLAERGTRTHMVGNVGDDSFGQDYKKRLAAERIDVSGVTVCTNETTGMATITVEEPTGENRIYLAPNANHAQSQVGGDVVPAGTTVAVFQLEIPLEKVISNIKAAKAKGAYTILNPAPAVHLPDEIYSHVDCIILNETEADILCNGQQTWNEHFFKRGVRDLVILTMGPRGVKWAAKTATGQQMSQVPAEVVRVVDTTAAGDTFVGAFASRMASRDHSTQQSIRRHIEFANSAAALTVTKPGAMDAIPTAFQLEDWLDR